MTADLRTALEDALESIKTNPGSVYSGQEIAKVLNALLDALPPTARAGGPWTRHGHTIAGVTLAGTGRPPVARCGGPGLCPQCSQEASYQQNKQKRQTP